MREKHDLRAQLRPLIVARGIRATARAIKVDHSTLMAWLQGRRNLNTTQLEALFNVLNIRVIAPPGPEAKDPAV